MKFVSNIFGYVKASCFTHIASAVALAAASADVPVLVELALLNATPLLSDLASELALLAIGAEDPVDSVSAAVAAALV